MKNIYKILCLLTILLFSTASCFNQKIPKHTIKQEVVQPGGDDDGGGGDGGGGDGGGDGGDDGGNSELPHLFCDDFPSSSLCKAITGLSELTASATKPILKNGLLSSLIYWNDPEWYSGYTATIGSQIIVNFSVGLGSILALGQDFTTYVYDKVSGAQVGVSANLKVVLLLGGGATITVGNTSVGHQLISIAVFSGGVGYLILPPITIAA